MFISVSILAYCLTYHAISIQVVVFSKTYCPFCTSTKTLFEQLGVDAKVYELDAMDDGAEIQAALLSMTGQRSVPNVFVKGQHIGGNDDTQAAARAGKLQEMLELSK
jgi:glutaredoxin 3